MEAAIRLARVVNDAIGGISHKYPDSFAALATLAFLNPNAMIDELDYWINQLGFKGACIGPNVGGRPIDDPAFYPFYERMSGNRMPIHIHPRTPWETELFNDYRMTPMAGFEIDLYVAAVRLIMAGILEKFSGLNFVVSHLGGAIPYLTERIENCYRAYLECRDNITKSAFDYLKRFYWDTVSFHQPALMCAHETYGAKCLVLGSDYPRVIGDIGRAITSIEELPFISAEREMIFFGNLKKMMGI